MRFCRHPSLDGLLRSWRALLEFMPRVPTSDEFCELGHRLTNSDPTSTTHRLTRLDSAKVSPMLTKCGRLRPNPARFGRIWDAVALFRRSWCNIEPNSKQGRQKMIRLVHLLSTSENHGEDPATNCQSWSASINLEPYMAEVGPSLADVLQLWHSTEQRVQLCWVTLRITDLVCLGYCSGISKTFRDSETSSSCVPKLVMLPRRFMNPRESPMKVRLVLWRSPPHTLSAPPYRITPWPFVLLGVFPRR